MNFRRFIMVFGVVVLVAVIVFFWGCEKSQPTAPKLGEISPLQGSKTRPTCNVELNSGRQTIRGFGGMNFPRWINDLSSSQVDRAFGTGSGQIGLSILRISVPPNSGDWSGEVTTAQRAKNHGAIVFATPWSPPASMKSNNRTTGGSLKSSSYGAYANHLRDFCNYMSSNGASLYAISVQNEPDYVPDYESCGWSASQMRTFLNNNASVIPVRVIAPETVHPKSSWYSTLSSCSQLDIYADHLYGGSPTSFSKEHWMTEHYTNSSISGNRWPDALDAGVEISNCMANNYSAYIWWYIRRSYGLLDESGNVTKRGYIMSHFSKFVRPGYTRINATHSPTSNVYVTAYKNGNSLVIVAINRGSSSRSITFSFSGNTVGNITKYETTSSSNVSNRGSVSGGSSMTNTLAGYSISTFVGTIGGGTTTTTTTTAATTSTTTTSGGGEEHVWLEAECGNVGSLWNTPSDGSASGGTYVTIQSGNNSTSSAPSSSSGHITYNFSVSSSGNYIIWGRVIAPNGNDDSFWIRMDGGSWVRWNNIASGSSWHWDEVHNADNSNQVVNYNLSSGSHTLTVAYREDGTRLDKIYITNSGDTPSGTGGTATNCGGTTTSTTTTTAATTSTTTTSGSTTTTTSGGGVSVFECENYTSKSSSGYIGNSGSNYSGSGYFNEESGSWFEWNNINISGNVTLRFRYAAAATGRTSTISVNGSNIGTLFNGNTGGWDSYSTEEVTASLNSGSNTIRVTRAGGNARIDRMEVIEGGGTTTTTSGGTTTTTTSASTTTTTSGWWWGDGGWW